MGGGGWKLRYHAERAGGRKPRYRKWWGRLPGPKNYKENWLASVTFCERSSITNSSISSSPLGAREGSSPKTTSCSAADSRHRGLETGGPSGLTKCAFRVGESRTPSSTILEEKSEAESSATGHSHVGMLDSTIRQQTTCITGCLERSFKRFIGNYNRHRAKDRTEAPSASKESRKLIPNNNKQKARGHHRTTHPSPMRKWTLFS